MARVEQTWSASDFDAIGIRAHQGKFVIQGIDGDKVKLEGNIAARYTRNLILGPVGRWLQIYSSWQYGESQFTLQLPKSKIWTIDIFSGKAQFKAENIQAHLHAWFGKGEVQIENCRGVFTVTSGNADVRVKHFVEIATPEVPPLIKEEKHVKFDEPESWGDWGAEMGERWGQWGEEFGNQFGEEFGEKFLRQFFGHSPVPNPGLAVQTGKGDIELEDFDVKTCSISTARGDARLKQGRVGNFYAKIISGDINCESLLPAGDWNIRANRGDVHLSLSADTRTRLDVTTRHGEIISKTPLVRVTRQGPESWHGGRMVGSIGANTDGKLPEIKVSTLNGDIEIKTESGESKYYEKTENENSPAVPVIPQSVSVYDTPLAVLTALSDGKISVDEAERLLRGFKP